MQKNNSANEKNGLLENPEQDRRTAQSARMIAPYTDQEIEQLYNQKPIQNYNQNEHR